MADNVYLYPDSHVLINKLNIHDSNRLLEAEEMLTSIRLMELEGSPVKGRFDFNHLKDIHRYIFQDLYDWAGEVRTVEIGKGNLFCTTPCIPDYAESVFARYFPQCYENRTDPEKFVHALSENYGDLNALHPFREGNGRTQREFARELCLECGYIFDLSGFQHADMLSASKLSFNHGDSSGLYAIFRKAVLPEEQYFLETKDYLSIHTLY